MRTYRQRRAREDCRQVIRIRDVSPDVQIVDDSQRTVWGVGHPRFESGKRMPLPACVPATATSGRAIDDTPGFRSVPGGWNG